MSTTSDRTYYYEKQCNKNLKKINEYHRAVTKGRPGAKHFPGYCEHNIWLLSQETREKLEPSFNFNFLLN